MILRISGHEVLIDDEDYELVKGYSYCADRAKVLKQGLYYFNRSLYINKQRTTTKLHRDIVGCTTGDGKVVDHINGNTLDCRKENLRVCSSSENNKNISKRGDNTSGYKGVVWHKASGKWMASIGSGGKRFHLGLFSKKEDAFLAYCESSLIYHGEYGNTGKPIRIKEPS